MKIVIAGSYNEFRNFIENNKYDPRDFVFADSPEDVRGCGKVEVVYVGRYWKNPLFNTGELYLAERGDGL